MKLYSVTKSDATIQHVDCEDGAYFRVNGAGDLVFFNSKTNISLARFKCDEWFNIHNMRAKIKGVSREPGMKGSSI